MPVKSHDSEGLTRLSYDLKRCQMTVSKLGFECDLNNSSNLLQIVRRLPFALRNKWAEKADRICLVQVNVTVNLTKSSH